MVIAILLRPFGNDLQGKDVAWADFGWADNFSGPVALGSEIYACVPSSTRNSGACHTD